MVLRRGHGGVFTCVQCGASFRSKYYAAKYCSYECKRIIERARRRTLTKPCKDCGKPIRMHLNVVRCTSCKRKRTQEGHVFLTYNLTAEEYDELFEAQGGLCAICHEPPHDWEGGRLSVDHDHETGYVRGLLHRRCNTAIGTLHTEDLLEAALRYLRNAQ